MHIYTKITRIVSALQFERSDNQSKSCPSQSLPLSPHLFSSHCSNHYCSSPSHNLSFGRFSFSSGLLQRRRSIRGREGGEGGGGRGEANSEDSALRLPPRDTSLLSTPFSLPSIHSLPLPFLSSITIVHIHSCNRRYAYPIFLHTQPFLGLRYLTLSLDHSTSSAYNLYKIIFLINFTVAARPWHQIFHARISDRLFIIQYVLFVWQDKLIHSSSPSSILLLRSHSSCTFFTIFHAHLVNLKERILILTKKMIRRNLEIYIIKLTITRNFFLQITRVIASFWANPYNQKFQPLAFYPSKSTVWHYELFLFHSAFLVLAVYNTVPLYLLHVISEQIKLVNHSFSPLLWVFSSGSDLCTVCLYLLYLLLLSLSLSFPLLSLGLFYLQIVQLSPSVPSMTSSNR